VDNTWAQLADGLVANDVGSIVQMRTQLWQAAASTEADVGLTSTHIHETKNYDQYFSD